MLGRDKSGGTDLCFGVTQNVICAIFIYDQNANRTTLATLGVALLLVRFAGTTLYLMLQHFKMESKPMYFYRPLNHLTNMSEIYANGHEGYMNMTLCA